MPQTGYQQTIERDDWSVVFDAATDGGPIGGVAISNDHQTTLLRYRITPLHADGAYGTLDPGESVERFCIVGGRGVITKLELFAVTDDGTASWEPVL